MKGKLLCFALAACLAGCQQWRSAVDAAGLQAMQGVYVLDGVGDGLDFPGGAPSAHVLIVSHPGDDGACTVLAFDNGQFFDTPQCSRYVCRAKDGNTLRSSSQDAEFAFERVGGDIAGV